MQGVRNSLCRLPEARTKYSATEIAALFPPTGGGNTQYQPRIAIPFFELLLTAVRRSK